MGDCGYMVAVKILVYVYWEYPRAKRVRRESRVCIGAQGFVHSALCIAVRPTKSTSRETQSQSPPRSHRSQRGSRAFSFLRRRIWVVLRRVSFRQDTTSLTPTHRKVKKLYICTFVYIRNEAKGAVKCGINIVSSSLHLYKRIYICVWVWRCI